MERSPSPPAAPVPPAPAAPVLAPPARTLGSVRRTSHVDMLWDLPSFDDELRAWPPGALHLRGAARDARTGTGGAVEVLAEAAVDARVVGDGTVASLETRPRTGDPSALVGAPVRQGFRQRAADAFPAAAGSVLGLLLDDLPVAALIAGYARIRGALARGADPADLSPREAADHQADLCAGWVSGGTMILGILSGEGIPYRAGPVAPPAAGDDSEGWHAEPPLPPGAMRRRRRIDVARSPDGGPGCSVHAMFRDTWVDLDGREEVLHEYEVRAALDGDGPDACVTAVVADPRVLPFGECPGAAAAVHRLAGLDAAGLRRTVRTALHGTDSCTHLNDLLRALGDVPALAARLGPP